MFVAKIVKRPCAAAQPLFPVCCNRLLNDCRDAPPAARGVRLDRNLFSKELVYSWLPPSMHKHPTVRGSVFVFVQFRIKR